MALGLTVGFTGTALATPVVGTPPAITPAGPVGQGTVLTVTPGSWTPTATTTTVDAWSDCTPANVCTTSSGSTYTVPGNEPGHTISVTETATDSSDSTTATATSNVVTVSEPPANTIVPTITGTAAAGTLTEGQGTWTNTPTGYTYQWLSCTGSSAATCTAISGATAQTYTVPAASDGLGYEVQETASNVSGSGVAATSLVLIPPPPANNVLPAISGTAALGQVLTASTGTWLNGPTGYTYQWQRCAGALTCSAIAGATGPTYTLTSADAGFTTEVQVTAANAGGSASISSAGSALPPPPVLRASPFISGTPQQGQTLTANAAAWTNSPTSITRQWYLCDSSTNNCVAIAGATAQAYVPTAADVGGTIQVLETATNAGGSATAFSQFIGPVTNMQTHIPAPTNGSPPGISGATQQGATLAESHGAWTGNPGTFSYQWLRCRTSCSAVPGATGQTYDLGPGDVGYSLRVQETAGNGGGNGNPATSAATGVVTTTSSTGLVAPQRSVTNQQVTLVATVTSSSGNAAPSGSVSFRTASGPIAGCGAIQTNATGQSATVTCQTSFVRNVIKATAVFSAAGGSLVSGSASQTSTISVGAASTATHLAAPGQAAPRTNVKYTASVAPKSTPSRPSQPSGTVTFLDRGKAIHGCSGRRLVKASASCQVRYTALGAHRITARYGGNANFGASTSTVGKVTIGAQSANYVTSVMRWYVHYSPTYTQFTSWLAYGVPTGSTFYFTCAGKGCPFASHTLRVANSTRCTAKGKTKQCPSSRTVNLEPIFKSARLAVGATVKVSILRCGWYGKHYTIKIRPRRGPSSAISNLPVGATRPGLKC